MRQAERRYLPEYWDLRGRAKDFLDFCYTPDLGGRGDAAAAAALRPRRCDPCFSDILPIADALGRKVWFVHGEGAAARAAAGPGRLDLRRPGEGHRASCARLRDGLAKLRATLPEKTTLIGFAGAPWTVATYMLQGRGATRTAAGAQPTNGRLTSMACWRVVAEATARHLAAQAPPPAPTAPADLRELVGEHSRTAVREGDPGSHQGGDGAAAGDGRDRAGDRLSARGRRPSGPLRPRDRRHGVGRRHPNPGRLRARGAHRRHAPAGQPPIRSC